MINSAVKERRYWLLAPGEGAKLGTMAGQGIAAIGWKEIGDLEQYETKEEIREALEQDRRRIRTAGLP